MKRIAVIVVTLLLVPVAALAQQAYPSAVAGWIAVSVTNASSTPAALPSSSPIYSTVTYYNSGSKDGYCALGGSGVVATTATPTLRVPAGKSVRIADAGGTYVACITAGTDTTTIDVYQSNGAIDLQ